MKSEHESIYDPNAHEKHPIHGTPYLQWAKEKNTMW